MRFLIVLLCVFVAGTTSANAAVSPEGFFTRAQPLVIPVSSADPPYYTSQNPDPVTSGQAGQSPYALPREPLPDALLERQLTEAMRPMVSAAWARPAAIGATTAVYFTLRGANKRDDRLISVSTPWAKTVQVHDTIIDDNGVARMREIEGLLVSANAKLVFEPNGRHVMLIGLKRNLRRGTMFPVTLTFKNSGPIRAMVEVRGPSPLEVTGDATEGSSDPHHEGH